MESNKEQHELKPLNISDYIKTISLLGLPLALTMGSVYLWSYYSAFDINVFEFIAVSDILTLSLKPLIILAVCIFIAVLTENQQPAKFVLKIFIIAIFIYICAIGLRIFSGDTLQQIILDTYVSFIVRIIEVVLYSSYTIFLVAIYFVIISGGIDPLRNLYKDGHIPFAAYATILCYPILLIMMHCVGKYDAYKASLDIRRIYYAATAVGPIKENKNLRYIGKTGSHFFVWDSNLEQTHILRVDSVNHLAIGSK